MVRGKLFGERKSHKNVNNRKSEGNIFQYGNRKKNV